MLADNEIECAAVVADAWTFLDGECAYENYSRLCQHLETCEGCVSYYTLQGRIKNLIATKCRGDTAPDRLRSPHSVPQPDKGTCIGRVNRRGQDRAPQAPL
jgi:mycothiol system anti-sigma-R factor